MAVHKGECLAVRAAALRFLAVAMTVSSSQAAQEAQLVPFRHQQSGPPSQSSPRQPDPNQAAQQACSPAGLEAASADGDAGMQVQAMPGQGRRGLAGPLLLQSDFGAQQFTQEVWDFGVEQLLLQGSFWEEVPSLLQVCPLPCVHPSSTCRMVIRNS